MKSDLFCCACNLKLLHGMRELDQLAASCLPVRSWQLLSQALQSGQVAVRYPQGKDRFGAGYSRCLTSQASGRRRGIRFWALDSCHGSSSSGSGKEREDNSGRQRFAVCASRSRALYRLAVCSGAEAHYSEAVPGRRRQ